MNPALVPVKRLGKGKSRLEGLLDREAQDALMRAMLEDVVAALRAVPAVDAVVVVTPDASVVETARAAGAEPLLRDAPGLNPSLETATAELVARGAESLLVVLGDVAGARPEELGRLYEALDALGGRGAVIAPAADGGTAALLRAPANLFPSRFGPESAKAHRKAAEATGAPWRELVLPSLALDLDLPEDLRTLTASPAAHAPRTRALLARLDEAGRG